MPTHHFALLVGALVDLLLGRQFGTPQLFHGLLILFGFRQRHYWLDGLDGVLWLDICWLDRSYWLGLSLGL